MSKLAAVLTDRTQDFTDEEKAQARSNIGAGTGALDDVIIVQYGCSNDTMIAAFQSGKPIYVVNGSNIARAIGRSMNPSESYYALEFQSGYWKIENKTSQFDFDDAGYYLFQISWNSTDGWRSGYVYDTLSKKQKKIADLDTIRTGAALGATALQSYTETDPVFSASVAAGITSNNISAWNAKQDALVLGTGYGSTSTFDETSNYVTRHTLEVYRPVDDKDFRIYSCGFRSSSGAHQSCTIKCKAYVQMWENWQEGSTVSSVNEPVAVLNYENFDMQRFGIRFDFTYLCYSGVHHFKNVDLVLDFTGSDFGAPGDTMVEMFGRKIRIPRMS